MRILYFGSLSLKNVSKFDCVQKLQNIFTCGVNALKWLSKKEFLKIIIEFSDKVLLTIYFSRTWPNLTEIGQIVVEL